MNRKSLILVSVLLLVVLLLSACAGDQGPAGPAGVDGADGSDGAAGADGMDASAGVFGAEYVTSVVCGECHVERYDEFMKSGHPYKLNKVVDGLPPVYPYTEVTTVP